MKFLLYASLKIFLLLMFVNINSYPVKAQSRNNNHNSSVKQNQIKIKRFDFQGNTVFTDAELAELAQNFIDKKIIFNQLVELESAITKKYQQAGYINSFAYIPIQNIDEDGIVEVQILEGEITEIKVIGTDRLQKSYIINRLKLATQKPFNTKNLLKGLQLLQINPLIKTITANLSPGTQRHRSLLEITLQEGDYFNYTVFMDNGRAPSVGTWRRGIRINEGNLLGFADSLNLTYTNTDGSNALDISYTIPFNPRNGTIQLAGGVTETSVTEPPFDRLDITGDSNYYEISINQPLSQTANQEFSLGLKLSHQQSKTNLFAEGFPLSRGANDDGETRISALRFSQNFITRNPTEVLSFYSQFSFGLGLFNATTNNELPDSHFFSWRGQGQYVLSLNRQRDMLFIVRSDVQLTPESLVPLEQFSIGGIYSVRGYRQDALLTDNGIFMTTELQFPLWRISEQTGTLSVIPFLDFGVAWNSDDIVLDTNSLLGTGLGLQWQMGNKFKARIDWGIPLTQIQSQDRTLQENGLYFSLESRL